MHLGYHELRMNRSREELCDNANSGGKNRVGGRIERSNPINIAGAIRVPDTLPPGLHRCRVDYGNEIDKITFTPYVPRKVNALTLVESEDISYAHKFTDRSAIEQLRKGVTGDDILIVRRGYITDTSHANVAFYDGSRWVTPASPLLPGTTRERLLDEMRLIAGEIRVKDLARYTKAVLFNAMIEFQEDRGIDMANIR